MTLSRSKCQPPECGSQGLLGRAAAWAMPNMRQLVHHGPPSLQGSQRPGFGKPHSISRSAVPGAGTISAAGNYVYLRSHKTRNYPTPYHSLRNLMMPANCQRFAYVHIFCLSDVGVVIRLRNVDLFMLAPISNPRSDVHIRSCGLRKSPRR